MPNPGIFVSHDPHSERGTNTAIELANHVRTTTEFHATTSGQDSLNGLMQQSPSSNNTWVVLVRTTRTMQENSSVYAEATNALQYYMEGRLRGVLALAETESEVSSDIPPLLSTIATYDISTPQDKQEAFERIANIIQYNNTAKASSGPISPGNKPPTAIAIGSGQSFQITPRLTPTQGPTHGPQQAHTTHPSGGVAGRRIATLPLIIVGVAIAALIAILIFSTAVLPNLSTGKRAVTGTPTATNTHASSSPTIVSSPSPRQATLTPAQAQALYTRSTQGASLVDLSNNAIWGSNESACTFNQGTYKIETTAFQSCMAKTQPYKNFAYEVKMIISSGTAGGLIFRSDGSQKFYRFALDNTGTYNLFLCNPCVALDASDSKQLKTGQSSVGRPSPDASNALSVIAKDSTIYLYINKQYVDQVQDASLSSGLIGLYAATTDGSNTVIKFSDLKVWSIK